MSEQQFIDPFSHPDNEEKPLREAAEHAHERFTETGTGEKTGVLGVGMGVDTIFFYVKTKKAGKNLPRFFMGHPCEVKVVGTPKPLSAVAVSRSPSFD